MNMKELPPQFFTSNDNDIYKNDVDNNDKTLWLYALFTHVLLAAGFHNHIIHFTFQFSGLAAGKESAVVEERK